MSDDSLGLLVEFQAKYDTVTQGFNQIAKGTDQVIANNKKAETSFASLGKTASDGADTILNKWLGLGVALSAAGLIEFFNKTAESINHLSETARGLGVNAQDFQKLSYGAQLGGVGVDELGDSLKKFNITLGQALSGNDDAIASFKNLGINVNDLRGKDLASQYATVTTAAAKMKDSNIAASNAMQIFGRNYTSALSLGRDGLQANIKEFDTLGVTLDSSQRDAVKSFEDSKTKLDTIFEGFTQKVVADTSPAFTALITGITNFIQASGGIDGLATNVGNKIVSIVQATIDTFTALKPGFEALLDILSTLVSSSEAVFNAARSFANTSSDIASQGNTNAHASNPSITDFLADLVGYGHNYTGNNASGLPNFYQHVPLANLITGVGNPSFDNYDPNSGTPGANGASYIPSIPGTNTSFTPGISSTTNPYSNTSATAAIASIATAASKSTTALNTFGDAVQKSSDSITAGFKALDDKDKNSELQKIFGIVGTNQGAPLPDQPGQDFEKDAADLIQQLKAGGLSSNAFNSGVNLLRQDQQYNTSSGFSTQGFDQVIEEIQKYANSLGVQKQQVEVGITVTPTKDFAVKVFTNTDAAPYLAEAVAGVAAQAASTGAQT